MYYDNISTKAYYINHFVVGFVMYDKQLLKIRVKSLESHTKSSVD